MSTIFFTLSLSLVDSLTTTQQIIIFALLLTTAKPLRSALSYLAGLSGAYFVCGIAGYLVLDDLRVFLGKFFPAQDSLSNPLYYQSEFLMGMIVTAIGIWWYYRKEKNRQGRAENFIVSKLRTMNGWFAFGLGIFISVTSFPTAIPYLAVLYRYSALHLELPAVTGGLLLYNIGYASPMILIWLIYLFAGRGANDDNDRLHEKVKIFNVHLTAWTLAGFGLFSIIDAGCYFVIGHALLKGRYF